MSPEALNVISDAIKILGPALISAFIALLKGVRSQHLTKSDSYSALYNNILAKSLL